MHQPGYGAPPEKKGLSNGWKVAITIGVSIFVLGGSCVAWVVYKVASNPDFKNAMGAIGDTTKIMMEAQKAPGTKELREAGCVQAFAVDMNQLAKIGERFDAQAAPEEHGVMVTCEWKKNAAPPCDELATIYAKAASPPSEFNFTAATSNQEHTCSGTYDSNGARVGSEEP